MFDELKVRVGSAPILKHFDPTLETILETDPSDYVVSGILSQRHPDPVKPDCRGSLHPVAFLSEKMSPAECNYGIGKQRTVGDNSMPAEVAYVPTWGPIFDIYGSP